MSLGSWTTVHDTVQALLVQMSGLPADHVIWDYGNADAPTLPYMSAAFKGLITVGQDGILKDYDPLRPAGQEFRQHAIGVRETSLELAVYTDSVADDNDAMALLDRVRTALRLDINRSSLGAVDLSIFDPGPVQYVPEVVAVGFRGRALCEIRCYVPAPLAEAFYGYIQHIRGTITVEGSQTSPITVPLVIDLP